MRDAVTRIKEVATYDRPYVKRAAWVHTEGLPKVFYDAIRAFSQREFPISLICTIRKPFRFLLDHGGQDLAPRHTQPQEHLIVSVSAHVNARRVEKRTTLRAEWTSGDSTERFFDYVLNEDDHMAATSCTQLSHCRVGALPPEGG